MSTENVTLLTRPTSAAHPRTGDRVHPASSIAKRGLDIVASGLALIVLAPVMVIVAILVFLASPGSVTFKQKRLGFEGESFRIIKFRTMVADAEKRLRTDHSLRHLYLANNHKIPAHLDTRITKIGRFLRATSLDELPQFWNVFVGHMSLVGPRPIVTGELDRYGEMAPVYQSVRPGLTGLWQVSGRSTVSYDERVDMDVEYVTSWSFRKDIVILLKTVPAVLKRHGAH